MKRPPPIPRTEPNAPAARAMTNETAEEARSRVAPRGEIDASCYQVNVGGKP